MPRLQFTCLLAMLVVIATGVWLPRFEARAPRPAAPPVLDATDIAMRYSEVVQSLYFLIKDSATVPDEVNAIVAEAWERRWLGGADELRDRLKDTPLAVYGGLAAEIFRQTGMQWRHCRQQLAKGAEYTAADKNAILMLTGQSRFLAEDLLARTR